MIAKPPPTFAPWCWRGWTAAPCFSQRRTAQEDLHAAHQPLRRCGQPLRQPHRQRHPPARPTAERVRTDVSCTVFLSDPDEYDGGELTVADTYGTRGVKLPAGHAVLYPGTSLHQVTPVTRGQRLACFFWVESLVRSDEQRRLLFDLDMNLLNLRQQHGETRRDHRADRHVPQPAAHVGRHMSPRSTAAPILPEGDRATCDDPRSASRPQTVAGRRNGLGLLRRRRGRRNHAARQPQRLEPDRGCCPRVLQPLAGGHTRVSTARAHPGPPDPAGARGLPAPGAPRWRNRHGAGRRGPRRRAWC